MLQRGDDGPEKPARSYWREQVAIDDRRLVVEWALDAIVGGIPASVPRGRVGGHFEQGDVKPLAARGGHCVARRRCFEAVKELRPLFEGSVAD